MPLPRVRKKIKPSDGGNHSSGIAAEGSPERRPRSLACEWVSSDKEGCSRSQRRTKRTKRVASVMVSSGISCWRSDWWVRPQMSR